MRILCKTGDIDKRFYNFLCTIKMPAVLKLYPYKMRNVIKL